MQAIGILGTASNAGKSWCATALCAWLRRQGVRVAPFKAQNMSNNAYATIDGGEIGIAQAVQAAACGLRPSVEMNPILLKPAGDSTSQIIRLGRPVDHVPAHHYYQTIEESWNVVRDTLDDWQERCDVLVMEGAGSPVELNIADRDIANFRPIRYVNGEWILVADIERGGVFAQVAGTYALSPPADQARALGYIVNRFRGDTRLFLNPDRYLAPHCPLPYLGLLPMQDSLQIDEEDSLCQHSYSRSQQGPVIAWVRFPHISNSPDIQAWRNDEGVQVQWANSVEMLEQAAAIVLPGTKNTLADLAWLRQTGLADCLQRRAAAGVPIVGICGGYQMLGTDLHDPQGVAGPCGMERGLGLLPLSTEFSPKKTVIQRTVQLDGRQWDTYEIHSGQSTWSADHEAPTPLLHLLTDNHSLLAEGACVGNIWGSYQHGLFDGAPMRQRLVDAAALKNVRIAAIPRKEQDAQTFAGMADLLEQQIHMEPIRRKLGL